MSILSVSNITDGTDTVDTGYVVNGSVKAWVAANSAAVIRNSSNISSTPPLVDFLVLLHPA